MISAGDKESAELIELICREEIQHVAIGTTWFKYLCQQQNLDPIPTFHKVVRSYIGIVPPPFNTVARTDAGLTEEWYLPVALSEESSN